MIPRNRTARVAGAVGATVAAGAVTMLGVTATASADEPGRCLENVNIREEPDTDARIVALCERGTRVELGEDRDGFVRIDELGGWAAKDYVKADSPSSSSSSSSSSSDDDHGSSDDHRGSSSDDEHEHSSESGHSDESGDSGDLGSGDLGAGDTQGAAPLGGLLG